jgi:hypothetical protein
MNQDENDDLWRLMGRAKAPEVSPFFSRNVLREVRREREERPFIWGNLRPRWAMALLGTFALVAAGAGLFLQQNQPISSQLSPAKFPRAQIIR